MTPAAELSDTLEALTQSCLSEVIEQYPREFPGRKEEKGRAQNDEVAWVCFFQEALLSSLLLAALRLLFSRFLGTSQNTMKFLQRTKLKDSYM